jgi:hypothetical protein
MQQIIQKFTEKPKAFYKLNNFPTFYGILNPITIFGLSCESKSSGRL